MSSSTFIQSFSPVALIGGSSFLSSSYFIDFQLLTVDTPFGPAIVRANAKRTLFFVQRHAASPVHEYSPPHLINKRAIIFALASLGCNRIIAFGSVGSLKKTLSVGSLVLPDDYYLHGNQPVSFFEFSKSGHLVPSFDSALRSFLQTTLIQQQFPLVTTGVYAQTVGPRFETPAEIKLLSTIADVVGMTCGSEAELAKELGLAYSVVCMVDNMANGLQDKNLTPEQFHEGVKKNLATMEKVLGTIIQAVTPTLPSDGPAPLSAAQVYAATATPNHSTASSTVSASSSGNVLYDSAGRRFVDMVVHARWIVPIEPENVVYENYSLVVHQKKILDILPRPQVASKYISMDIQHLEEHCVMPSLVNCHTHLGMTLLRGYADDHCLSDWLTKHIWPAEGKFVSNEFVRDSFELGMAELIRGGCTTVNDMYFYPEVAAKCVDELGVRGIIGLILLDFPTMYAASAEEYFNKGTALRSEYVNHPRIHFALSPHAPYTVSDPNWERVEKISKATNCQVHTHLHETAAEVEDSINGAASGTKHLSQEKCSPLMNFNRMQLVNKQLIAVHMTQLTDAEIGLLAKQSANVIHCPCSNLKLAAGFCPIGKLSAAGVNVALGTDSAGSNNSLDMFLEMRTAALLAKGVSKDATVIFAHEALRMATINGARALALDKEIGSLTIGKSADFIAVHFGELESSPLQDVASQLVYASSRFQVTDVWSSGKQLLRDRQLLTLSMSKIMLKAREWEKKLADFKREQAQKTNGTKREKSDTILIDGNSVKQHKIEQSEEKA